MRYFTLLPLVFLAFGSAFGQRPGEEPVNGHVPPEDCPMKAASSPYAGYETRDIKALSDEDRERLLEGHGMGMALAAELNRYPGPKHVLELADALELLPEQVERSQAIFDAMAERARQLGRKVVELEAALDARFAGGTIDEPTLAEAIAEIGRVRGELRLAHLRAHLEMRAAMSDEQIAAYDRLRGYRR